MKKTIRSISRSVVQSLRPVDALTLCFLIVLSFIVIIGAPASEASFTLIAVNGLSCLAIVLLAIGAEKFRIVRFIHDWYPVAAIFLVFKEIHEMNHLLGGSDQDQLLIAIDHAIFGVHPTVWIGQFSSPPVTEILEIAYASYYFIMLAVGIELFVRGDRTRFSYTLFIIVYGFFLSYLGYLALPAVGPRFTLHDFSALSTELPGLFLTEPIRAMLNAGESIPSNGVNAVVFVQRDVFPSGHTELTLISLYLATRFRLRSRYILYVFGTLLIISTVYLRYHYVVDLFAGALFMLFAVWTAPAIFRWWEEVEGLKLEV